MALSNLITNLTGASIAASYTISASTPADSVTPFDFPVLILDTYNCVTPAGPGTNWKFTAPCDGTYQVSAAINSGQSLDLAVAKNDMIMFNLTVTGDVVNTQSGTRLIWLDKGDFIDVRPTGGTISQTAVAADNWIAIHRI